VSVPSVEFVILTGFLGSGKTTLLRQFLTRPEAADTAVIVNEVGEIGLDGVILREGASDTPMALLSNGCLCCQRGSDLSGTIDTLLTMDRPLGAVPLQRIVLETSGLSKPGPLLRQLTTLADHRLRVAVVATFDAVRGAQVTEFEEAAAQWAAAHRIVVTKSDVVSEERLREMATHVAALNPVAQIVATADRESAVTEAFTRLPRFAPVIEPPRALGTDAHPRISVCLVRPIGTPTYADLATWLDDLAGLLGERLLRLKGLVQVAECEQPLLVQSVGTLFSAPRPLELRGEAAPLFLVIIARDLEGTDWDVVGSSRSFAISGQPRSSSSSARHAMQK